ncbi:nSTAND1 domain-containing NTPase [Undibacterium baiyunense]|uniref:Novel STAND NTPase 1 domain-containing protein n=1 Tax=Undibacterium baiyunense TaxID=2828731 RepID=A0A941DDZ2_9BURK|nr:hypothetical protein [Undibacterium baiyunense]MBR7745908.1 hypothetical protein [Undibacterium baiyunense]
MKFGDIYGQWYLNSTPFAVEALKCNEKGERLLQGRDQDITNVMHKLHRNARITCIDGHYGSGKTSLVNVAIYKCLKAFKAKETNQILIPCKVAFQLKDDLDVDEFTRNVLQHVVLAIKEHQEILTPICDITGFDNLSKVLSDPILSMQSGDLNSSFAVGVPGIASFNMGGRGGLSESVNNSAGFNSVGFEFAAKNLLEKIFTSIGGGVVCVIDNIELLETATKARKTLELLRDRLLTTKGLRWVFCGANGVIHSLAASPRLSAFLNTPVLDLQAVRKVDLKDVIEARIEEYSIRPEETFDKLPFGLVQIEWLYDVLNYNLRDLLSHLEQYCEYVSTSRVVVNHQMKDILFKRWVRSFGEFNYKDISKQISKNAWLVLDAAMSDDFRGTFNAGQFDLFNRNSKIPVTPETFRKWLRDLKRCDIITQSIPNDLEQDSQDELELETYSVTSKGALVFYYRLQEQQTLTLSQHHDWLKRVSR